MRFVEVADEIVAAVQVLARHRYAAIILLEPAIMLAGGVLLDAVVSREILVAVFTPDAKNHLRDGVTVIRGDRVERAGVPLAWRDVVERAAELASGIAIGIDEDTGKVWIVNLVGRVEVVEMDGLASVLQQHVLAQ